jgi:hypothetical protein
MLEGISFFLPKDKTFGNKGNRKPFEMSDLTEDRLTTLCQASNRLIFAMSF